MANKFWLGSRKETNGRKRTPTRPIAVCHDEPISLTFFKSSFSLNILQNLPINRKYNLNMVSKSAKT